MKKYNKYNLWNFMKESNKIEGEDWNDVPMEAMEFALAHVGKNVHPGDVLKLHKLHERAHKLYLGGKSDLEYGKLRTYNVRVGMWLAPPPEELPELLAEYCANWKNMNAWEAHVRFEQMHPFGDLNGRTGRLLWLIKALKEGYDFSIPFLQMFYYQTLKNV